MCAVLREGWMRVDAANYAAPSTDLPGQPLALIPPARGVAAPQFPLRHRVSRGKVSRLHPLAAFTIWLIVCNPGDLS